MAVYTEVGDAELEAFLAEYDIGEADSFKGVAEGVENSNYLLTTTRGQYFLTLYEKRVDPQRPAVLPRPDGSSGDRGITCPKPIHGRDGKALRTLAGKPAAITTFLHGLWPRRIALHHCAPVGEALAALHLAGRDFALKRPNALSVARLAAAVRRLATPRRQCTGSGTGERTRLLRGELAAAACRPA